MIRHTLKLALRNFKRHKSSFFINLVGLSTGLACTMLIVLWVQDELQVDKFHAKDERLFRVMEHQQYAEEVMTTTSTPGMLAETLKEEVPEIEHGTMLTWPNRRTLSVGEQRIKAAGYDVSPDFFRIFSFPLIEGQPETVLRDINAILLSRSTAENLFQSPQKAMGQALEIDQDELYTVTGVFEDIPSTSSIDFDYVVNFEKLKKEQGWLRSWSSNGPSTIVTLVEGADAAQVSDKIAGFVKQRNEQSNVTLFLKPYSEIYLHGKYEDGKQTGGRIEYVRLFSIIAVFILIIACINFMNLSTARASLRAKEVGVKKAVGAGKSSLIRQFMTESVVITLLSLLIAVAMVWLFLPQFNLIADKEMTLHFSPQLIGLLLGLIVLTGLLAGSYPALYLSSFKPVAVLKGELRSSLGELWARRGLVVFQFTLSVVLIVAVVVVYNQLEYIQSKNLGYDKDQLIKFAADGRLEDQGETFLAEAGKLPGVEGISAIAHDLVGRQNNTSGLDWEGKDPESLILFEHVRVDYGMLETMGVELKEGRFFSEEYGADTSKIIFNERAVEILGFDEPIGKKIRLWDEYDLEIVGVVKDFHFQSLHEEMNPLFFRLAPGETWTVMARLKRGEEQPALNNLQILYEDFNPGFSFDYQFLDEEYALQYEAEQRVSTLSKYFAGFAVLISCLGLFGLAAFTADRKRKEIGIRKVLGAGVGNIVLMLTRDFTRLVLVSILIGLPVAYYLTSNWLQRFAYRIDLNLWFFALAGLLVLLIAWMTVSSQAFRSAQLNPTDCLRDE